MLWPWIFFNAFVIAMLALDLGVFHKNSHEIRLKEALAWSAVWLTLALIFNGVLYFWKGQETALQFLTGYVIEKSLSIDNIFIFILIFSYFKVPAKNQHDVLFWGILSALVMRAVFILVGVTLIHRFHWIIYVFGVFLFVTGIKMFFQKETEIHPENNPLLKWVRKVLPLTSDYEGNKFFVKRAGKIFGTPLLLVLLTIEITDVIFAVDSIPAVLAVTPDPFIVYTSNVFAILGLRSLYFALAGVMPFFHYLRYGLSVILAFVGIKMVLSEIYKIPTGVSLTVIVAVIAFSVVASLIWPKKPESIPA